MDDQRCETCRFWGDSDDLTDAGSTHARGHCKRFPPSVDMGNGWNPIVTDADQWCAEWRAKDSASDELGIGEKIALLNEMLRGCEAKAGRQVRDESLGIRLGRATGAPDREIGELIRRADWLWNQWGRIRGLTFPNKASREYDARRRNGRITVSVHGPNNSKRENDPEH